MNKIIEVIKTDDKLRGTSNKQKYLSYKQLYFSLKK